ncbi:hypothetical protein GOQ30_11380 [Flavobacterium sp. TP390]|uniref:Uncharacterized protein n=1 Tax=Flavobacterium profundi TaxID=1774945 RepID=A0A6I4IJ37_9FLAO|nr:hypothetical protein [Flavobacterium profundi]MVO09760.1 hypothetical protein [Flavobacterium profundi]
MIKTNNQREETIKKWNNKYIIDIENKEIFYFDAQRDWFVLFNYPNRFSEIENVYEKIIPKKTYVIYADSKYLVSSIIEMPGEFKMIEIYDEPPSLHTDLINLKNLTVLVD